MTFSDKTCLIIHRFDLNIIFTYFSHSTYRGSKGCVKTTNEIIQTESNGCSAEVACNIIRRTTGGPFCGTKLRARGDLTGQPANHNWNLRAQPLQ